jgi:hypothetical protein
VPVLMALTVNEIRRLFAKLITNITRSAGFHLAWSRWRRVHQARARASHYRARGHAERHPGRAPRALPPIPGEAF